ncbi:hypothetical protein AOQ84DRAFT_388591 [Glonium stellatum]|uniref:Uncharacterized protein n=1 Tax=Glonium stellatum TaxID=574774 RepID=A0A8E2F2L7_9PEZI|nr:hypothetical protein AOQ84DRAFT_388591 [Glonium stellatum]
MGFKSDPIYKTWYPFVLTDEAMTHAMIFFLATVLDQSYHKVVSTDWRTHADQATRLISERLSSEKLATADASIAAVIVLATAEFIAGNLDAFDVHMDGVARMVELRGGLTALESYPFLKRKIRQVDVTRAVLRVSQPRFPLVESRRLRPPLNTFYSDPEPTCGQGIFQLTQQHSILCNLIEVFGDMYELITAITSSQGEGNPHIDPIFFLDSTSSILHRLTTSFAPIGYGKDYVHLYECCRLGTLLFTRGISEQSVWPPQTRIALFDHVKESLRPHIKEECAWMNLKLWTLFMAGVTATGLPQRTWFTAQAANITLKLDIRNWEDIRVLLKQFWWLPKLQEWLCKDFWEDIVNLREVLSAL